MEIRKKLTYQFIGIVAIILLFSMVAIYISFSKTRQEEFFDRLSSKAKLVAQMLIDIDEIDSELLKRIELNNPLSLPNEKIIIYDYQDEVIYTTDDENILSITNEIIDDVRLEEETQFKQGMYEIFGQFYTGQYDRIVVFAAATDIFGMNKIKRLRIILVIVFVLSLIIVYFSGRLFAVRALAPISQMVNQVNKIELANLGTRIDEGNGQDEIAHLAKTFNKMLERLEAAFKIQKNFIANASHELRTPLTVITGQLEVILMKARTNEEYKNALLLVLNDVKDLNALSNKLLMLAQTSTDRPQMNFVKIRIDDALWKAQQEINSRNKNYSININFGEGIDDENKLSVSGNDILIKTVFINLIDNACKYSLNHHVDVTLDSKDDQLVIHFTDKGIGIIEEELKMIFNPFYRSKNTISYSGHGIGLSLVENIVKLHKGTIQVVSALDKGTKFTIKLPICT
ncbi:sensor histidine kinase [Draconibacterium sp.]|uniref:sensor histidine kinase n=1 Tax=Draconibacterium sp. TaxID=1965318 RepID=UPI003568CC74